MKPLKWWQTAVFYQIYPRSFADGNGDGIGDLYGAIQKLDYLKDLGIDGIWLSPHFPSPQFDCGYDVADYVNVHSEYGTLATFKQFLDEAHKRDIRVILDLVLNHTSHLHPWFLESRSSRDNPKRDWYVWHDGKNGAPPNNWDSTFGGSAWEYDDQTQSYYYHYFFKEQPDLNWRNPEVRKAMWDAVRFWLDMGVDGYRLDAIGTIYEDPAMPDHKSPYTLEEIYKFQRKVKSVEEEREVRKKREVLSYYQHDQPGMHELMQDLRSVIDEYDDRMLVGETEDISYMGDGDNELHMVFNFTLMRTTRITPDWVRANQKERLAELPGGGWPCNTLGNHDSRRLLSRYTDGQHGHAIARVNLALMLTMWGTPFLYNGEEIGMSDYLVENPYQLKDLLSVWAYGNEIKLMGDDPATAMQYAAFNGRDQCRTPMQWSAEANAGFCPAWKLPWLPVNPNHAGGINVADQQKDPNSMLNFYRHMLALRRKNPALIDGDYQMVHEDAAEYLAYTRCNQQQKLLVVLNMFERAHTGLKFELGASQADVVYSNGGKTGRVDLSKVDLQPFEILILSY